MMTTCASCGRHVDLSRSSSSVCPSCTWRAALKGSQTSTAEEKPTQRSVAMAARLHELTLIAGERLDANSMGALEAVARGNTRVYEAEITRLANRFVEQLEARWKA